MEYIVISLGAKLKEINGDKERLNKLKHSLSLFKCARNLDEESFIQKTAISFEEKNISRTYLLISEDRVVAYFSLAYKHITLEHVSKKERQKMICTKKYSIYSSYLIAHLAKDDSVKEKMIDILLDHAFALIYEAQEIVGGRLVYLDCKNESKIIKLYEENGFEYFNTSESTGLKQYYKIL